MTQSEIQINIQVEDQYRNDARLNEIISQATQNGIKLISVNEEAPLYFKDQVFLRNDSGSFSLDWARDLKSHLKKNYSLKSEPLAKALGITNKQISHEVIDCTLGTGKDAILLLSFGSSLQCFERNPNVFVLCLDALLRAVEDEEVGQIFKSGMRVYYGEAWHLLHHSESSVAYFDPMYPAKKKKALPRKEMQVFKDIVGPDGDIEEVLAKLRTNFRRVVVKRPVKSDILEKCSVSFKGKTTRYDRYDS